MFRSFLKDSLISALKIGFAYSIYCILNVMITIKSCFWIEVIIMSFTILFVN